MKNKIFTGVFALLLFGLAILTLALPKKTFSETENRTLAALPKPTKETVLDGHGIFYRKTEVWIESERLYEVLYTFEMEGMNHAEEKE